MKVLYTAVILGKKSQNTLISKFKYLIPKDWEIIAHHMTITLGELSPEEKEEMLDKVVTLKVVKIGVSNMAIAAQVDGFTSKNRIPHITIAINKIDGGKPKMSNYITNWTTVEPFELIGVVKEVV